MSEQNEKKIEELTAEDLEQVVGGASTGTPDSFLKLTSAATPSPAGGGTTSILKHQD
jgi:bacteriocin-like protein